MSIFFNFLIFSLLSILSVYGFYKTIKYLINRNKDGKHYKKWVMVTLVLSFTLGVVFIGTLYTSVCLFKDLKNKLTSKPDVELISTMIDDSNNIVVKADTTKPNRNELYQLLVKMNAAHPKVAFCQFIIESGNFTSNAYVYRKNMSGMKKSYNRITTREKILNDDSQYASYYRWEMCVLDYIIWSYNHGAHKMTEDEYIQFIGKIYAEAPNYDKAIRTMLKNTDWNNLQ